LFGKDNFAARTAAEANLVDLERNADGLVGTAAYQNAQA
jgi:hypothetical protein